MKPFRLFRVPGPPAALLLGLLAAPPTARCQEVVAVLSAQSGPFREAAAGFDEAWGSAVPRLTAERADEVPAAAKVVVAYGSPAAQARYGPGVRVVAVLAPAAAARLSSRDVYVPMMPGPDRLLEGLRRLQPKLRRVRVLWNSPASTDYVVTLRELGAERGILVQGTNWDGLEDPLKLLKGLDQFDSLWLMPEPELLTADGLKRLVAACRAGKLPLILPLSSLTRLQAAASVGASFSDMGRAAALAARALAQGRTSPRTAYASRASVTADPDAAAEFKLVLSTTDLSDFDQVLP